MISISPSQKLGMEMPETASDMIAVSTQLPWRSAPTMPRPQPQEDGQQHGGHGQLDCAGQLFADHDRDRPSAANRRAQITLEHAVHIVQVLHRQGIVEPQLLPQRLGLLLGTAWRPSRTITGSPGTSRSMEKVSRETPTNTKSDVSRRRVRYAPIYSRPTR